MGIGDERSFSTVDAKIDILFIRNLKHHFAKNRVQELLSIGKRRLAENILDSGLQLCFFALKPLFVILVGLLSILIDGHPRNENGCN